MNKFTYVYINFIYTIHLGTGTEDLDVQWDWNSYPSQSHVFIQYTLNVEKHFICAKYSEKQSWFQAVTQGGRAA